MDWLRIPSISADPAYAPEVDRAADWLVGRFRELNVDRAEKFPTAGHPIVFAEKQAGADKPTVLVYGHYDVQPPDPLDLWTSGPFEPVIKDGKVYARGSSDDKGQVYMHLKALEIMNHLGTLPCNIKFVIEGEEEVGSRNLDAFLAANKDLLRADVVLVSDTTIIANDVPSISSGIRGLAYVEVEVTGPNRDLHSGMYGGPVVNPLNALCQMIGSLHDANGRITIPGFYDDVQELSLAERAEMRKAPFDYHTFCNSIEIAVTGGEKGYTPREQISIRPTLDVNGMWGGYTGEGAKTVLPSKAFAKISMRLVPNQDDQTIMRLFQEHFERIAPAGVQVLVKPHHGGPPAVTPTDSKGYQAAAAAMETTFGKRPVPVRSGGSIPIVLSFKTILGLDTVLMGFGLDTDAIHSPNESYGIFNFLKGIETIPLFYQHFGA